MKTQGVPINRDGTRLIIGHCTQCPYKTAVVAIGGNAILLSSEKGTKSEHLKNIKITCKHLAELIKEGYDLVLTHGNGPQVGNIMLQNERSQKEVPPMPLDVCGAETQGEIGYLLQQTLTNELNALGIKKTVVSVVTQVLVDKNDPAFTKPTKPIGPYYKKEEAIRLIQQRGWNMALDKARGGWRRVVPSPLPLKIVEKDAIMRLIFSGKNSKIVVIASGGGGIPVIKTKNGYEQGVPPGRDGSSTSGTRLVGVEAVIDKDLAASVLASSIKEKLFIMLTDIPRVALNFGKENQIDIPYMNLKEAKRYLTQGHFPPGSMGPKIKAAISFLENSGDESRQGGMAEVIITSPDNLLRAIKGKAGTHIYKNIKNQRYK